MDKLVANVSLFLSFLTVVGDVLIIAFITSAVIFKFKNKRKAIAELPLFKFISRFSFHFVLIVALTATLGSLFYSEIALYEPCKLCWYQRILMYPQVILIIISLLKKDFSIADYLIALSSLGALISVYHYYIQRGGATFLPCSAIGYSASCSDSFFMQFGYVTIPAMAASAFLLIIILMIIGKSTPGKIKKT